MGRSCGVEVSRDRGVEGGEVVELLAMQGERMQLTMGAGQARATAARRMAYMLSPKHCSSLWCVETRTMMQAGAEHAMEGSRCMCVTSAVFPPRIIKKNRPGIELPPHPTLHCTL